MLLISYSLFKENELCTFQLNRRSYVLLRRAIMTLHLFSFLYVFFFFFFISVGLSQRVGGRGFSPATFIENKRKIEPDELSGYTILLLLIAYARQLVASFLLSFPFLRVYHKFSIPTYMLPSYLTSEGRKVTFCPLLIPSLPSTLSLLLSALFNLLSPLP